MLRSLASAAVVVKAEMILKMSVSDGNEVLHTVKASFRLFDVTRTAILDFGLWFRFRSQTEALATGQSGKKGISTPEVSWRSL